MALSLSSQGLASGSFSPGTFTAGMAFDGVSTYYPATAQLTAAGTVFDPAVIGTQGDGAWGGGNATLIALGKNLNALAAAPVPGAVTTNSPTYTTGTTAALSLTTAGALRVNATGDGLLATAANQPTNAAQGSTTTGQTGTLIQGAASFARAGVSGGYQTSALTAGDTYPALIDLAGQLRTTRTSWTQAPAAIVNTTAARVINGVVGTSTVIQGAGKQALQFLKVNDVGKIQTILVTSKATVAVNLKVFIFNAFPATAFTDGAAPNLLAADIALLASPPILVTPDSSLAGTGTMTVWGGTNLNIPVYAPNGQFYMIILSVAAFTPASTSDIGVLVFGE